MKTAIKPRVNIPLSQDSKLRATALARKRRISLSRFLQEAIEERLRREARADLERRLERSAREMAEENLRECRAWEPAEAEVNRMLDLP